MFPMCYILPVRSLYSRKEQNMPAPSKRGKQSRKRYEQNKAARTRLKTLSRNFYRALDEGDTGQAQEIRDESQKAYDKAAVKGVIHPNKASRKVSRLDKALATATATSGAADEG